ncbi:MAG: hypothetical protein U0452_02930 [Anaerolineae bacterium]
MAEFPNKSDRIAIAVGLEHWREGETTLSVDSSGQAEITNRRSGELTRFDGFVTSEQLSDLSKVVGAIVPLQRENKPRKPDDVPLKISLIAGDEVTLQNNAFWYGDRYSVPEVNQVIRLFNQMVKQISNGAIST